MKFIENYMQDIQYITERLDYEKIELIVKQIKSIREAKGRLFILGVGGSAGNASHMVNDLRKLCNVETYAPTDNVSEITARTNDEGFDTIFTEYLKVSNFSWKDGIFILSVGGCPEGNISVNLLNACHLAHVRGAFVMGIIGKNHGRIPLEYPEYCVVIPHLENYKNVTPLSESFQAIIWHSIVSHPDLQINKTTW